MNPDMALLLAMTASVFIIGAVGELTFSRTRVPDVVWLMAAGLIVRFSGVLDQALLDQVASMFSTLVLVVVLFESGTRIVPADLRAAAPRALPLAIGTFLITMVFVAVISVVAAAIGMAMPTGWTFSQGLMLGAMLGGASSLVVSPALQAAKIRGQTQALIDTEARIGEALAVVVSLGLAKIIAAGSPGAKATIVTLGLNLIVAIAIGIGAGWVWVIVLRQLRGSQYGYPVTLSAMILLYLAISAVGTSPAAGVLTFAIVVGNAPLFLRVMGIKAGDETESALALDVSVVDTHRQFTFVIKCCFFAWVGLRVGPPISLAVLGFFLAFALSGLRLPLVRLASRGADEEDKRWWLLPMPHGMAAGVLSVLPEQAGLHGLENLSAIVFSAVMTSVIFFTVGYRQLTTDGLSNKGEASPQPAAKPLGQEALTAVPVRPSIEGGDAPTSLPASTPEFAAAPLAATEVLPAPPAPPAPPKNIETPQDTPAPGSSST